MFYASYALRINPILKLEKKKTVAIRVTKTIDNTDCTRTKKSFTYILSSLYHRELQPAYPYHQDNIQCVHSARAHAQVRQTLNSNRTNFQLIFQDKQDKFKKLRYMTAYKWSGQFKITLIWLVWMHDPKLNRIVLTLRGIDYHYTIVLTLQIIDYHQI